MANVKDCSTAQRLIENKFLSAEINTVLNLPINAMPMAICEDMSEQLHIEIIGKCAMTNFMHSW
jgi:hypothetical protein